MKYIPLLKYLPFLLFVIYSNNVNSQSASIFGFNKYDKEPTKSWPEVVGCFDLDSFAVGKVEQNGKIYLVLNKKTGPNQWVLASPNIFPNELMNKYLKYTVVTNEGNIYESLYWEPLGTLKEEFIQTYTAERAWGHEVIGMDPNEEIIKIKFYFYSSISNCTLSDFYCLTEWTPEYDVFELNVNNLNYFLCGAPSNLMCPIIGNIEGNVTGDDLILSAQNINNSEFLNLANQALVYELGIEIKGYNGSANETRFINIPINSSFNIEQWQETLTAFGVYSEYRVTLFYKIFDTVEFISCDEEIQLPISTTSELCQILNLLKHTKNGDTLSWSFTDIENSQYYSEALSNLGISASQAQNLYQNVDAIDFDLEYSENGGQNQNLSIHHIVGNDSLPNLLIQFAPLNFQQLNGTLKTTYYYNIDGIEECSSLPFEYLIENPGNGILKDYECGKNYNIASGNGNENILLYAGDVFEVNGLTCQIKTISSTSPYSGTGIISLPFTKKRLKVTFDGVVVDSTYVMTNGTVLGVRATPGSYPNFLISPDTISINGDICLVTPKSEEFDEDGFNKLTGLNARGFNRQGIHHKTNTNFDERGFDINGVHKNGKIYDDFGCNVEGLDSLGAPCEPNISEEDLKSFIDSNLVFIDSVSMSQLNGLMDKWQDSLQALNCSSDSLALIALINSSQAINSTNRQYIEGQQKEYISPQMSNLFSEEPKVITQDNTRDQIIKNIETKHIELYRCDKEKVRYIKMLEKLEGYSETEIKNYIKSKLLELTPFQVDQFKKDKSALIDWIILTLSDLISPEMGIGHINQQNEQHHYSPIITNKKSSPYHSLASVYGSNAASQSDINEKEENYWLFDQGFNNINGVSRAYYLKELHNQMLMEGYADSTDVPMPLQLLKMEDGLDYSIYLDNFRLTSNSATLSAYFILKVPESGKNLVLKAENVKFGPSGLEGEFKLKLETTIELRVTNNALLRVLASKTYVDWDCQGFKAININGEVELCRGIVIPLDPVKFTPLPEPERLKIDFEVYLQKWNDLYITFNQNNTPKPFVIAGYDKIQWSFNNIVLDLSDYRSPTNITYPTGYKDPYAETSGATTLSPQWRGFAINLLEGRIPGILKQSQPKTISVQNLIIDNTGVSVSVSVSAQILALNEGNLDGWPISIDKFHISILNNQFLKGGFGGQLKISILKDSINYNATFFENGGLEFTFSSFGQQKIPMFLADVNLDDNSSLSVYLEDTTFVAIATLNGNLHVNCSFLNVQDISFKEFKVSNKEPYFDPGTWGMKDSIGFSLFGFGINIHNIGPVAFADGEPGLAFNLDLNLVEKLGIDASGGFVIRGQFNNISNIQNFSFNKLELDSLTIDVEFSAGYISGSLYKFDDHPTYGTGFFGGVVMELKELFTVKAYGQFGKISTGSNPYKYFYVDANLELEKGIPAFGPLELKGFSGGVSYAMTQELDPNAAPLGQNQKPALGQSANGIVRYLPSPNIGLGLSAGVLLSFKGQESLFKGAVELRVEFNSLTNGGGLNNIALNGSGVFMTSSNVSKSTQQDTTSSPYGSDMSIAAHLRIKYNFDTRELHGEFKVFLEIPGILEGAGENKKLVNAEAHFTQSDWWVYIGLPKYPAGVKMQIPGFGQINYGLYFDMGTRVPEMREIPNEVRSIIGNIDRNTPFAEMTRGFVFGAYLNASANLNFGIASGYLSAGLGFDISLREYKGLSCGSYNPIGFDGWYARGQVYAYLTGGVRFLGVEVLNAGVAAVMQARMPRPFFAQAALGVRVKIGPFKVKKTLNIEIGDKCSFTSSSNNNDIGFDIIEDISPMEGVNDVKNNEHIIVSFGMQPNLEYEVPQLNGSGIDIFKATIKSQSLTNKDGDELGFGIDFPIGTEMHIIPNIWFNAGDTINYIIEIDVLKNGVLLLNLKDTTYFTIKGTLDYIPLENVEAAYPFDGMANFYRNEFKEYKGMIQLNQGMPQLLYDIPSDQYQKMKLTSADGNVKVFEYNYDPINRQITFPLDPEWLDKGKGYKLEMIRFPKDKYTSFSPSKKADFNSFINNMGSNPFNLPPTESGEGDNEEKSLYSCYFRVSQYEDLGTKLESMQYNSTYEYYSPMIEGFTSTELDYLVQFHGYPPSDIDLYREFSGVSLSVIYETNYASSTANYQCDNFTLTAPQDFIGYQNESELEVGESNFAASMSINPNNQKLYNNLNATFYSDTTNLKYWIENCVLLAVETYGNVSNYTINGPNIINEIISGAEIPINKNINITYSIPGFNVLSRTYLLDTEN